MKTSFPARAALLGSLSLLLAACASPMVDISMQSIRSADYGIYPKDYRQRIRQHLNRTLLDGGSARVNITMPPKKIFEITRDWEPRRGDYLKTRTYYLVCIEINAKNAYGGYTGWQTQTYEFENGRMKSDAVVSTRVCDSKDDPYIDNRDPYERVNILP